MAVVAQGAANSMDIDTWLPHLLHVKRLYIATDANDAGTRAAEYWFSRTRRAWLGAGDVGDGGRGR